MKAFQTVYLKIKVLELLIYKWKMRVSFYAFMKTSSMFISKEFRVILNELVTSIFFIFFIQNRFSMLNLIPLSRFDYSDTTNITV